MASKLPNIPNIPNIPDDTCDLLYVKRVIKGKEKHCGYRRDYLFKNLTEMEEGFVVCKICSGIMRQASLCEGETTCLFCSEIPDKLNPVNIVQSSVAQFAIKCPILSNCQWKGKLSEAEMHLQVCDTFRIECFKCKQIFRRKEKNSHNSEFCPMREIVCKYECFKSGYAKDLEKHETFCKNFPILCQNGCGIVFAREDYSMHKSVCALEEITCPYAEYGCDSNPMLRRDLLAHKKNNIVEHTDMSLSTIKELKKEKSSIEWKIMTMKQLDGVEWEIVNMGKFSIGRMVEGPTFYVNNYKLRIYVTNKINLYCISNSLHFTVKRLEGKFDKQLGIASITQYRVIIVDKRDNTKFHYEDGPMNYQLTIGENSEILYTLPEQINNKYLTTDKSMLVRFYFDINSQPPLGKVEDKCYTSNIERSLSPPKADCDPFNSHIAKDF